MRGHSITRAIGTIVLGTTIASCSGEPRGGPRLETFPVSGIVYVDGNPAGNLLVECYPDGTGELKYELATYTDADGNFSIGTYEAGDGIPVGNYTLTFQWITGGLGRVTDRLGGKYANPKTSEFEVEVVQGVPTELGIISLESP